jgi:hypothetical protein
MLYNKEMSLGELLSFTSNTATKDSSFHTILHKDIYTMSSVTTSHIVSPLKKAFTAINVNFLARRCTFQKRTALKANSLQCMMSYCLLAFSGLEASFSTTAFALSCLCSQPISKQAVKKRCNGRFIKLIKLCLASLLQHKLFSHLADSTHTFRRILLHDSTFIKLHNRLAAAFPGSSNQKVKKFAQAKIQAILDIKNARFLHFSLTNARRNDQKAARDILKVLRAGDLVLRDLGYFGLGACCDIIKRGAFFISRYRFRTAVFYLDGTPLDLLALLKKRQCLDIAVLLGAQERLKLRLVAIPVADEVANTRRRRLRENRDRRCKPTALQLALQGWTILITNVSAESVSAEKVVELYGLRWRIEMVFKSWKSHFGIHRIPVSSSPQQVRALIYTRLITILMFHTVLWLPLVHTHRDVKEHPLSYLKCSRLFVQFFWLIALLYEQSPKQTNVLLEYHCKYEKRKKRKNFVQKALEFSISN